MCVCVCMLFFFSFTSIPLGSYSAGKRRHEALNKNVLNELTKAVLFLSLKSLTRLTCSWLLPILQPIVSLVTLPFALYIYCSQMQIIFSSPNVPCPLSPEAFAHVPLHRRLFSPVALFPCLGNSSLFFGSQFRNLLFQRTLSSHQNQARQALSTL